MDKIKCINCGKVFSKKGIATHIWRSHGDGKNHKPTPAGTKTIWNKGLTKETNSSLAKAGRKYSERIAKGEIIASFSGRNHKKETIEKLKQNCGGYRQGSGRGKYGWYNGYWCDSSWELAWIIFNLEHDIKFERNKNGFEYKFNEKKYNFFPDFKMTDGTYVEIKGYLDSKNKAKIEYFPHTILILGKNEIKEYINYVIKKYGKDFIRLYKNSAE